LTVDGIDATDNLIGASVKPDSANVVDSPVPLTSDSVQEFGVGTTNSNANYGRGEGGQFTFVTKRGTNALHGALYEYLQNNVLNSNTWDRNRVGIANPKLEDNRFGGAAGGPIWKNRTFIFGNYEGRRLAQSATISRIVPTDSLRAGTLRFRDASGQCVITLWQSRHRAAQGTVLLATRVVWGLIRWSALFGATCRRATTPPWATA